MSRIRTAVSVLLTPDPASRTVFVVRRNPELRYFGGYAAFVGGTVDDGDRAADADTTLRRAAVREVLEETGVALVDGGGDPDLAALRRRLLAGETLDAVLAGTGATPATAALTRIGRITTPPFAPVRFATDFYWATLPADAEPEVWPGELVDGEPLDAGEALARWRRGDLLLAPPVLLLLERLAGSTVGGLAAAAADLDDAALGEEIRRIVFSPGIQLLPTPTRTRPPATHTNVFLVGGEDLWLVDPAPADAAEQQRLWRALDARLATGGTLRGILLTHHHPDHVGALAAAVERWRLPVRAHAETLARLTLPAGVASALADGEELPLGTAPDGSGGWTLRALHTPGHAPGHLAFRESRYGAVLAGDLLSTLSTIAIDPPEGHMRTYLASLARLREVADGVLYPSHGPPVRDGRRAIDTLVAHRAERETRLVAALGDTPLAIAQLVPTVYADVDPRAWPLAERSLAAGLEKLAEEGRAERVGEGWRAGRAPT